MPPDPPSLLCLCQLDIYVTPLLKILHGYGPEDVSLFNFLALVICILNQGKSGIWKSRKGKWNGNWKWKLETETGNGKQKWKRNFFAAVVLARFNCYPSALPASSFCFASLASFPYFLWCPSCQQYLSLVFRNQLILYKNVLYMRLMFESEHQYFCIGKYLGGGAVVGNGAIVPRAWVWSHNLLHTLQAIKTESSLGTRLQE